MTAAVLEHRYQPRGTARELFACRDAEVLMSGPAGTGKSRACMEKLHLMALRNPGLKGLIVRKTLASLGSTALATWRRYVAAEAIETGAVAWYGGSAEEPPQYRYENGSVIVVGGMDRSTRIMSSEYDVIYVQEAIELTEEDWEALTTRLRNWSISFQQLIADTNPSTPTHWLKARVDAGRTTMLDSRHEENPRLFQPDGTVTEAGSQYLDKLDNLTGVRHQRLRRGLWVAAEGIVYESWDPTVHQVDRFDVPDTWTRWWAVDFGFTNPFVLQCWAEDPDGRLFRYREIYRTQRLVEDHAKAVLDLVSVEDPDRPGRRIWTEPKPRAVVCDHDAEGRATLERALGLSTVAAMKKVTEGIQGTEKRLAERRLFLMRDSLVDRDEELVAARRPTCTEEEVPGYVWDVGVGKAPKEQPLKVDDHGCDAMRYLVAQVDLGSRPRIRWMG